MDIPESKHSFIKGRGVEINLVIASEILHSMQKKKGRWGWFALKIDLEKVYNIVEWSFVRGCLHSCNINEHSVKLILDRVSKALSSVLVNGRKSDSFNHIKGLWQGNLMSTYLFNICLEALTQSIQNASDSKDWTPFWVGRKKVPISHLLFADDLVIWESGWGHDFCC